MKQKITGYKNLVEDIKFLLEKARAQAYKAVDNIRVQTYWQIGERIAREELKYKGRAAYSKKIIKELAIDLGFSRVVLYRVLQFYKLYPIVSAVPRQLSWTHLVELLLFEFGENFSLAGRQRKIVIDGQIHAIDLEFFHRGIPCIVLVDLKLGRFKGEYVGQMMSSDRGYKKLIDSVGVLLEQVREKAFPAGMYLI